MEILLDIIVPVFGIVALGWGSARVGWFPDWATRGLSHFVFNFAIPAMLFRTLASQELPDPIEWGHLLSYYGGAYASWLLGLLGGLYIFHRDFATAAVGGMGGAFSNTVLLGIPLVLTTYGDAATLPLFLVIAFHSTLLVTTATILCEAGRGKGRGMRELPVNVARGLVTNPIVMGLLAGIIWNLAGWPLPKALDQLTETLGRAALPCAVFSMGASLAAYRIAGALVEAGFGVLLKLFVHPALVFVLATYVFRLDPLWRDVAVILAALPVGVNVYLFGQRYEAGAGTAATAMLLSTPLSVLSLAALLAWLGAR